jgi:hypothetical protein
MTNVEEYGGSSWAEVSMPAKQRSFRGLGSRSQSPSVASSLAQSITDGHDDDDALLDGLGSGSSDHDDNMEDDKHSIVSESTYGGYSAAGIRTGAYTFDQSPNLLPQSKGRRRPGQSLVIQQRDQHQFEISNGSIDSASRGGGGTGIRPGSTAPPPSRQRDVDSNSLRSTLSMLKQNQQQRGLSRQRDDSSADRAAGSAPVNYNNAVDGDEDSIDDDHDDGIYGQHAKNNNDGGGAAAGLTELQLRSAGVVETQDAEDSEYSDTTFTRSEDLSSHVKHGSGTGTSKSLSNAPINATSSRKKHASSVRSWKSGKSAASSSSWMSQPQISDHVSDASEGSSSCDEEDGNGNKVKSRDFSEEGSIPSDGSSVKSGSELQNMFHKPNSNNATQRDGSAVHLSQNSRWNEQSTRSGSLTFSGGPQPSRAIRRQGSQGSELDNVTDAGKHGTSLRRMSESNANATFNNKTAIGRSATGGTSSRQHTHGSLGLDSGLVTTHQQAAAPVAGSSRLSTIELLSQKSTSNETNSKSTQASSIPTAFSASKISYAAPEQTTSSVTTSVTDHSASSQPSILSRDTSKSSLRSEGSYSHDSRSRDDDYSRDYARGDADRSREDDDRSHGSDSRSAYSSHSDGTRSYSTEGDRTCDAMSLSSEKDRKLSTVHSQNDSRTSATASEKQSSVTSSSYKDHGMGRSSLDDDDSMSGSSHSRDSRILDHNDDEIDQYEDSDDEDMTTPSNIASSRYAVQLRERGVNDDEQTQETSGTEEHKSRAAYRAYADKLRGNMENQRTDSSHSVVSSVLSDLPDIVPRKQGLVSNEEEEEQQANSYTNKTKSEKTLSALGSEISGDMSMFEDSEFMYDDGGRSSMMMNSGLDGSGRSFMTEMTDTSGDISKFPEQPLMSQKEEHEFQKRKNDLDRQRQLIMDAAAATGVTVNSKRDSLSSRSHSESSATTASKSASGSKDQGSEELDAKAAAPKRAHRPGAAAGAIASASAIGAAVMPTRERSKLNNPYNGASDGTGPTPDEEEKQAPDLASPAPTPASLLTTGNTVKREPLIIDHDRKKTMLQSLEDLQRLQRVVSDLTIPADLESAHGSMRSGLSYSHSMVTEDEPSALDSGGATGAGAFARINSGGGMDKIVERGDSSLHSEDASKNTMMSASFKTEADASDNETLGVNVKHRIDDELAACKRLLDSNSNSVTGSTPSEKHLNASNSTPGAMETDAESSSFSGDGDYKNKSAARRTLLNKKQGRDGDAAAGSPLHDADEQEDQESDTGWTSSDSSSNQRQRNHAASKMASISNSKNRMALEKTPLTVTSASVPASSESNADELDVGFPLEKHRLSFRRDAPQSAALANAAYYDEEDDRETPSMNSKATPLAAVAAVSPRMGPVSSVNQSLSTADSSHVLSHPYEDGSLRSPEDNSTSQSSASQSQSTYSQSEQSSGQRRPLRGEGQHSVSTGVSASSSSSPSESTYSTREQSEDQGNIKAKHVQQYGFADDGVATSSHHSGDDGTPSHKSDEEDSILGSAPVQQAQQSRRDFMKDFSRRLDAECMEFDEVDDVEVGLTGNKAPGRTTLGRPGDDDSTFDENKKKEQKKQHRGDFCRTFTTPWWKPVLLGAVSLLLIGGIVAIAIVLTMNGDGPEVAPAMNTQNTGTKNNSAVDPGTGEGLPIRPVIGTQTGVGSGPVLPSDFASVKWYAVKHFESPSLSQADDAAGSSVALSSDGLRLAVGSKSWDGNVQDAGLVTIYNTAQDGAATDIVLAQAIGHSASEHLGTAVSMNEDGTVVAMGSLTTRVAEGGDVQVTGYNVTIYSVAAEEASATASRRLQSAASEFGLAPIGQSLIAELGNFSIFLKDHATPGLSLSLSGAGDKVAIGVPYYFGTGEVFVYERSLLDDAELPWQQMNITSNIFSRASGDDMYGAAVSLSGDGQVLAAGAPSRGASGRAIIFKLLQTEEDSPYIWETDELFTSSDIGMENANVVDLSNTIALNYNGSMVAIGAPQSNSQDGSDKSGFVAVLKKMDAESDGEANKEDSWWAQVGQTIMGEDANEHLGHSLAFSSEGSRLVVGAPGRQDSGQALGATLLFELASTASPSDAAMTWTMAPPLYGHGLGSGAGYSVSMSANGTDVASGLPYISNCTSMVESVCEEHGTTQLYHDPSTAPGNLSATEPPSESTVGPKAASFPSCLLLPLDCDACKAMIETERTDLRAEIVSVNTANLRRRHVQEAPSITRTPGIVQVKCSSNNAVVEDPTYEG